jgi:hypothetical protein
MSQDGKKKKKKMYRSYDIRQLLGPVFNTRTAGELAACSQRSSALEWPGQATVELPQRVSLHNSYTTVTWSTPRVTSSTAAESNIIDTNCPIYVVIPHPINFKDSVISNNQVKEHKMGRACSTNKGNEECM